MDDQSRGMFGDLPTPAIIINPEGLVSVKLPWAEPAVLGPRLEAVLKLAATRSTKKPKDARIALSHALNDVYTGKAEVARQALDAMLTAEPPLKRWLTPLALRGRARLHRAAGNHEAAAADLDRAALAARTIFRGARLVAALAEVDALRKK